MQPIKLNQTLGFYEPGFFKLYIATLNPIDLNRLSRTELATFVHEYTHFLQDFTTVIGLQNIFVLIEWLRLYVTKTYKHRKLPIPAKFRNQAIEANTTLTNAAYGSAPHPDLDQISHLQNISLVQTIPENIIRNYPDLSTFRALKAEAFTPNGSSYNIEIGTLAVMESMSHLAEGLMGLPVTNSPDYPYNTIRLLANAICPTRNLCDESLFALCDVALQCSVPGKSMHEMLIGIENGAYPTPANGYDVYNFFRPVFQPWFAQDDKSLLLQAYDHLRKLVHGPMGEQFEVWVDNIFSFAIQARQNNPAFLIDAFRARTNYINIVNRIGTPLMVNAVEHYSKVPVNFGRNFPYDKDVEFFPAIKYILFLFDTGAIECPMKEWCESSGIPTDNLCITNPPGRSDIKKYPELCPVGGLWRSWKLSRYQLKRQTLFRRICK